MNKLHCFILSVCLIGTMVTQTSQKPHQQFGIALQDGIKLYDNEVVELAKNHMLKHLKGLKDHSCHMAADYRRLSLSAFSCEESDSLCNDSDYFERLGNPHEYSCRLLPLSIRNLSENNRLDSSSFPRYKLLLNEYDAQFQKKHGFSSEDMWYLRQGTRKLPAIK